MTDHAVKVRATDYENMILEVVPSYYIFQDLRTDEKRFQALAKYRDEIQELIDSHKLTHGTAIISGIKKFDACSKCGDRWEPWDNEKDNEWDGEVKSKDIFCASCGATIKWGEK